MTVCPQVSSNQLDKGAENKPKPMVTCQLFLPVQCL